MNTYNPKVMSFFAKLESAAPEADKPLINAVRGKYVAMTCADNKYVSFLNKMESVAPDEHKAAINAVRGRYGMVEISKTPEEIQIVTESINTSEKNNDYAIRKSLISSAVKNNNFALIEAIHMMDTAQLKALNAKLG